MATAFNLGREHLKKIINKLLLTFVALAISILAWVMGSNSGLKWLLNQALSSAAVDIRYERLDGSLWSDINVEQLSLKWNGNNGIDIDSATLKANVFPLLIGKIDITKLDVGNIRYHAATAADTGDQTSNNKPLSLPQLQLPVRIAVTEVSIKSMNLLRNNVEENLFHNLKLQKARLGAALAFDELSLERQQLKIKSHADIPLNKAENLNLNIDAQVDLNDSVKNVPVTIAVSGIFPIIDIESNAAAPINLNASSHVDFSDLNSIVWHSEISSKEFNFKTFIKSSNIQLKNATLEAKGLIANKKLTDLKVASNLTVKNLTETLKDDINASLHAELDKQKWRITSLKLIQAAKHAELTGIGTIDTDFKFNRDTTANFQLDAKQIVWPENNPILSCDSGKLIVSGNIHNYNFDYAGDLTAARHAISNMKFTGAGDLEKLQIKTFNANYLNGEWDGSGDLTWQHELNWKVELHAKQADLAALPYQNLDQLHSDLTGTLLHDGGFKNRELYIHVSTPGLKGKINQSSLSAGLDFLYQNDALYFRDVKLTSRGTRILGNMSFTALSGDTKVESKWNLNSKDIGGFYPDLHGQVTSQGEISGPLSSPQASLNLQAHNLGYKQFNIASVNSTLRHYVNEPAKSKLDIQLKNVAFMDQTLSSINIDGTGSFEQHKLATNLVLDKNNSANFKIDATLKDKTWFATVSETQIEKDGKPGWMQPDAANLIISAESQDLLHLCLSKINAVDNICIDKAQYSPLQSNIDARIANINLGLLLPRINKNIHNIEGNLSGDIDLELDSKLTPRLLTNLYVSNAKIDLASYNPKLPRLEFERIIAKGKTESGAFIGSAQASIPGQGDLKANWKLGELQTLIRGNLNSPVDADLDISLYKLSLIPEFIPDAQSTSGSWENHIQVTGYLDKPKITGISKLNFEQLSIPRLGIKPKPTTVSLITDNTGKINFSASTKSGDGKIDIKGSSPTYQDIFEGLNLTAEGSKFQLFDLPEAKVVISPQLTLTGSAGILNLQGTVKVPYARIKIFDTSNSVTLSTDVKIIGQEPEQKTIPLKLTTNIKVDLGDDILIDTSGLKGKLSGSLTITDRIGKATTAVGELEIKDGIYNAYGRELTIEEGKIIFTSSPLENPSLQIKAVSKNSNEVVAGIKITGSARNPVVTLFSEPPLDQSDILAYIVLGYPINQANQQEGELLAKAATSIGFLGGEKLIRNLTEQFGLDEVKIRSSATTQDTSLVLGKYLSPKLYVQYALGIGNTANSMMLDYKWTNRISIKSESGQNQSTDIIYTFEKN